MHTLAIHICVCICTYKRPEYLKHLLEELKHQYTGGGEFSFSIVIVDNDSEMSARDVVRDVSKTVGIQINYYSESKKNIACARNKAVRHADCDYLAFIDDDEFPSKKWLFCLYQSLIQHRVDGVLGPVKPHFEVDPPAWLVKSGLCERSTFSTGTTLRDSRYTRTGNVLFKKKLFQENSQWFNSDFGLTGGEDVDFFKRMMTKGYIFSWCNEGVVWEHVPPERCTRSYFIKRALLRGTINSKKSSVKGVLKSFFALTIYTLALPVLFLAGHHLFMKYLIKNLDHIGKVLGVMGLNLVKQRNF